MPNPEPIDMAAALHAYDRRGMIELLAHDAGDNAFLVERCGTVGIAVGTVCRYDMSFSAHVRSFSIRIVPSRFVVEWWTRWTAR